MKRVYVAGPLTSSGSVAENIHNAIRAGNTLLHAGYWPHVPHLNYYWEIMFPAPYEVWKRLTWHRSVSRMLLYGCRV